MCYHCGPIAKHQIVYKLPAAADSYPEIFRCVIVSFKENMKINQWTHWDSKFKMPGIQWNPIHSGPLFEASLPSEDLETYSNQ